MKMLNAIIYWLLTFVITVNAQQTEYLKLTGPYLGQKPPGMTPEIFVPEIISSAKFAEFKVAFSPDGTEFYFYRYSRSSNELKPTIFFTEIRNGAWTNPAQLQIALGKSMLLPCVSHDNKWLFVNWRYPSQVQQDVIYASERIATGWSEPKFAGVGMYLTSDDSCYFYTTVVGRGKAYLAKMTFSNGLFNDYERLNIGPDYGRQAHPCIAPDGSYILFDTNGEHLFVSFKKEDV